MAKGKSGPGKKGHGSSSGAKGSGYKASVADTARFLEAHRELLRPIKVYTGLGYLRVNELLRDGFDAFAQKHGKAAAKDVLAKAQDVQRAVNRTSEAGHSFKGDVLRGQSASSEQIAHWIKRGEFTNRSLLSTTVAKGVANNFTGNVVLHLKQVSGVAIAGVSSFKHEKEVLIPAGRRFKITKTKTRTAGKVTHIYARQIT